MPLRRAVHAGVRPLLVALLACGPSLAAAPAEAKPKPSPSSSSSPAPKPGRGNKPSPTPSPTAAPTVAPRPTVTAAPVTTPQPAVTSAAPVPAAAPGKGVRPSPAPAAAGPTSAARPSRSAATGGERVQKPTETLDRVGPVARSVARVATKDLQLPFLMLGLMLAFLAVQNRIDRRDPKILQLGAAQNLELDFELPKSPGAAAPPRRQVPLRVRHVASSPDATSVVLPEEQ